MRVTYDETVDILYIRLREGEYYESDEIVEGIIVDFDRQGKLIAIEILDASEILEATDRWAVEFAREPIAVAG